MDDPRAILENKDDPSPKISGSHTVAVGTLFLLGAAISVSAYRSFSRRRPISLCAVGMQYAAHRSVRHFAQQLCVARRLGSFLE